MECRYHGLAGTITGECGIKYILIRLNSIMMSKVFMTGLILLPGFSRSPAVTDDGQKGISLSASICVLNCL